MATQRLSICTVKIKNSITWDAVVNNLLNFISEDIHCEVTEQTDTYIGGCYIAKVMQNQTQYNIETGSFETTPVARMQILRFDIFPSKCLMMLWGKKKVSTLFTTALQQAAINNLIIDYNKLDYKIMITKLLSNSKVIFTRMNITDVVIEHGIVANCSVNLTNQDNSHGLVRKYLDNISQISVQFDENTPTSLMIYSSGAIVTYRDRDDIPSDIIDDIITMIGG